VRPYQTTDTVLRYCVDGAWLELVEAPAQGSGNVLVHWGVDSLTHELMRLRAAGIQPQTPPTLLEADTGTATFLDPFGNTVGLVEFHDPHLQRARSQRAAEKIALRNVRETLDGLGAEDQHQRSANRLVAIVVVAALVLGALGLWKVLPHKQQEEKITIPLSGSQK
jgi:hypothetical protein